MYIMLNLVHNRPQNAINHTLTYPPIFLQDVMFVGYFVHNHTIMIFWHGSRLRASAPCSCHPYTKYHRARLQADGSNLSVQQ